MPEDRISGVRSAPLVVPSATRRRFCGLILNALTVPSLVIGIATIAQWVRSYQFIDGCVYNRSPSERWRITSERGAMIFNRVTATAEVFGRNPRLEWTCQSIDPAASPGKNRRRLLGFDWSVFRWRAVQVRTFQLPSWLFVASCTIAPLARIRRRLKLGPPVGAFCPHCGYDLTGNVSGTCPECGMNVVPPAA